jgi:hypothetical protein
MITTEQYLGEYSKTYGLYLSVDTLRNINRTLRCVNSVLSIAKVSGVNLQGHPIVTLGWTPPGIHEYSLHTTGEAIDIGDPVRSLSEWLAKCDNTTLIDFGLWMEDHNTTYCHLQLKPHNNTQERIIKCVIKQ